MIRIGEFSKLAHISIKALHHYGRLGLLRPVHTDRFNGYRYYALDQLVTVNRILALKDLGFALEQVSQLMQEDLSIAELRGMLRMKQIDLSSKLDEEINRLKRVEMRLRSLEHSGDTHMAEIAIKQIPAQAALTAVSTASSPEAVPAHQQELINLLSGKLQSARLKAYSPWFALAPGQEDRGISLQVQVGVGVQESKSLRKGDFGGDMVKLIYLPEEERMASIVHTGRLEDINQSYTDLYSWAQSNGMRFTNACREIFLTETALTQALDLEKNKPMVELQCPVEKIPIPISIRKSDTQEEFMMKPKFVTLDEFTTIGLPYIGSMVPGAPNEIPQLWGVFNQRSGEIKSIGNAAYGMCFDGFGDEDAFEYVACFKVDNTDNVPEGMVVRTLPAGKFAIFEHHGKLDKLSETYDFIYKTWLPQSGEKVRDMFDMEVYDDKFIFDSDESVCYIYVAVE